MNRFWMQCVAVFLLVLYVPSELLAKQEADLLILGANIITMNSERTIFYDGGLAIHGGKIVGVGSQEGVEAAFSGKEVVDGKGSWLIPGLVNTHTHAPMILLRGLGSDQCLSNWLEKSIWPVEKKWAFDPEFIEDGTMLAAWEMALNGTTTHLNSYFLPHVGAKACKVLGVRCVMAHGVADVPLFLNGRTLDELFKTCEDFLKTWQNDSLITPALAPHSLYLCSPKSVKRTVDLAEKYGALVTIHAAETEGERDKIAKEQGLGVVQLLEKHDCLRPNLLLSHAIWLDDEGLDLLKKKQVKIAHCPQSNMKLASGVAPIPAMLGRGITVSLGTDGAASNNGLDLFQEMDVAAKLQKVVCQNAAICPADKVFAMSTIEGAKALGLEKEIGSLEVGKCADIVILRSKTPAMCPIYDPYAHLVYAAKGHCVESVLVAGRWILKERRLVNYDEEKLFAKAALWQKRIQEYVSQAVK